MLAYSLVVTFPGFQRSPPSGACFKMGMDFYISKLFSCMFLAAICVGTGVVALDMMLWVAAVLAPLTCVLIEGNNWQSEQLYVFLGWGVYICNSEVILLTCFSALST